MIIITNPHFSQYRVSRDSLSTQLSNLALDAKIYKILIKVYTWNNIPLYLISGLSLKITIFSLKMMLKSGLEKVISKFYVPLQSCFAV